MRFVLQAIALVVLAATILPFLRARQWWIRIFDFPLLQIGVLGLLAIAGLAAGGLAPWERFLVAALAVAVLYHFARVGRYTPLFPKQVLTASHPDPGSALSLLTANVLMTNRDFSKLLDRIRDHDPDIILTVEVDQWWERALAPLDHRYPYSVKQPQDNTYGMILYSRLPLHDVEIRFRVEPHVPSISCRVELPGGTLVRLYCVHPEPPAPQHAERSTERDAELLLVGQAVAARNEPAVILGDLNDVAWSRTSLLFQRISGMLDPRVGRGLKSSFHADYPMVRFPLDHVFLTPHFHLVAMQRLGHIGSDHFPILVRLQHSPAAERRQETPQAEPEDHQEKREVIAESGAEAGAEAGGQRSNPGASRFPAAGLQASSGQRFQAIASELL